MAATALMSIGGSGAAPGVEQPDFAIGKLRLNDGSAEQHPVLKLTDRHAGIRQLGRNRCLARFYPGVDSALRSIR
jgi:hypothetical protein